jgi:hypothetical protein
LNHLLFLFVFSFLRFRARQLRQLAPSAFAISCSSACKRQR